LALPVLCRLKQVAEQFTEAFFCEAVSSHPVSVFEREQPFVAPPSELIVLRMQRSLPSIGVSFLLALDDDLMLVVNVPRS